MSLNECSSHTCPTDAQLAAWHARELEPTQAAAVEQHVRSCPRCAHQAAALLAEHESWLARCRAAREVLADTLRERPSTPAQLGSIPGYEVLEEIRRGGQGIVFRALQRGTKREVALKVLREGRFAAEATRRRFEREVELAATLRHPHIVTVFDSGQTPDGELYFAMDYIPGVRLDQYVRDHNLNLPGKLRLFSTICKAVNYAHQRGVIHRDLKPSNVLVDEEAQPHILDFGLARPVARDDATAMTSAGQVAGTLPYMSPEQARGLPDAIDVRSDVYALGVILYELLTGQYPYPVETDVIRTLQHIAETPPLRPSRRRPPSSAGRSAGGAAPGVDADLETIMLKALAKERDHRYQTAGELARDVDLYLAGEPIQARRDSSWYLLRAALRRYRLAMGVSAAFVVVICAALVVSGTYWRHAVVQRDAARAAEARAKDRFDQIRALARFFVIEFDPLLSHLPGTADARQVIARKGQRYLEILAQDADADLDVQLDLAGAYVVVGDIDGDLSSSNLGNVQAALANYRQAATILERIERMQPGLLRTDKLKALDLLKIADACHVLGQGDEALATYRLAVAYGEDALRRHPGDETLLHHLGTAHERLGYQLQELGQLDEALQHFAETTRINDALGGMLLSDAFRRRFAALRYTRQATLEYARGCKPEALECYRAFAAEIGQALASEPGSPVLRRDAAIGYQWLGIIEAELGRHEAALPEYHRSVELCALVLGDDDTDDMARLELATTLSKLGESQLALRDREAARETFEWSAAEAGAVAGHQPALARAQRLLGVSYYKLAELETVHAKDEAQPPAMRLESWRAAREWLRQCHAVFIDMRDHDILAPSDATVPTELAAEISQCDAEIQRLGGQAP